MVQILLLGIGITLYLVSRFQARANYNLIPLIIDSLQLLRVSCPFSVLIYSLPYTLKPLVLSITLYLRILSRL